VRVEERQSWILSRARSNGSVEVSAIATELQVAPETIRRDLRLLAERRLIQRTHGGGYPVESAGFETSMVDRSLTSVPEKRRIASAAAERLGDAETVFIDEGFTPQLVAEALPTTTRLTVVTSSLTVATALANSPAITVLQLGGRLRGRTMGIADDWTLRILNEMTIDLAYMGANGISLEYGLTTSDPTVGAVKAQAMRVARRKIFVGMRRKFGLANFYRFAKVSDFEALITSSSLPRYEAERYATLGPQVIRR
jgi:DeoR family fructose operon transcriptional repressor